MLYYIFKSTLNFFNNVECLSAIKKYMLQKGLSLQLLCIFPYSVLCRILSNVGSSFYITPTEKSVEIATKIRFNSSKFDVNMNIPVLTYWNKGKF